MSININNAITSFWLDHCKSEDLSSFFNTPLDMELNSCPEGLGWWLVENDEGSQNILASGDVKCDKCEACQDCQVSYAAMWHDEVGRPVASANYGTNGGATFTCPDQAPTRSDTVLVTTTEYNSSGEAYKTIDPAAREDRQFFDVAGRAIKTIQNYTDGNPSTGGSDEDVTTETTYTSDGQLKTLTAKNPTTGDQATTYVYGTTLTDSSVASSLLKVAEIYPDSADANDRITFKYNRQQEVGRNPRSAGHGSRVRL